MSNLMQTMSPCIGRIGKKLFPGAVRTGNILATGLRHQPPVHLSREHYTGGRFDGGPTHLNDIGFFVPAVICSGGGGGASG